MTASLHSFHFFLIFLFIMVVPSSSSSLVQLAASFSLSKNISLRLLGGSVTDFSSPQSGAIVNAANEGCLGGGGVDGAIGDAGGESLFRDREALPLLERGIRCPTGSAVPTGPGEYGTLQVPYVIHAVGPNYMMHDDFDTPDQLLQSAYQKSLDLAKEHGITEVAFALLSAGVFRGERDLDTILGIAVTGIRAWVDQAQDGGALESVSLIAFSPVERRLLLEVTRGILEEQDQDEEPSEVVGKKHEREAPEEDIPTAGSKSPKFFDESYPSDEQESYPSDEEEPEDTELEHKKTKMWEEEEEDDFGNKEL
jgi:O-acetyl-ADP-ribose deacetylase (regulator of RNase III)